MTEYVNLDSMAASCIADAAYDMKTLDLDALRESVSDQVFSAAESACIYYSACSDIIHRYESEISDSDLECYTGETKYKAIEWQQAMVAYANAVCIVYLNNKTQEILESFEDQQSELDAMAEKHGCDDIGEPALTSDCPHGWAPHEYETRDGVHYWAPAQLEGCKAVAVKTESGLWLSYTWTAESSARDDSESEEA